MRIKNVFRYLRDTVISLIIALALCFPGLPINAVGTAVISVSAPSQTVTPGSQFSININLQPNNPIAGAQFSLAFNPALVTVISLTQGNLLNQNGSSTYFSPGVVNNSAGTISGVAGAITTPGQTVSTAGTLAIITMIAAATKGTSALTLSNVVVGDINGQTLSASSTNGQISIDRCPILGSIGSKTASVGSILSFTISGSDADGDALTYSASGLPSGASFNAATRTFSWTPSLGQVGTFSNVHFEVSDGIITVSENISITVNKAIPVFSNLSSPSITYGATTTSVGGTIKSGTLIPSGSVSIILNGVTQTAAIDGSGNFISIFDTATLATNGSPYTISFTYSGNTNFNNISDTTKTLTINKTTASVTLSNLSQTYNGTAKSVTVTTNPTGLQISTTYNSLSTLPTAAGSYSVAVSITDTNYSGSSIGTMVIAKLTPVFSNLSSPSINFGTTPTSLGGTIKSGILIPSGNISITLNGVTQTATVDGSGNFSSSFVTGTLATSGSPYSISYVYTGDTNFNGTSDAAKTLSVIQAYSALDVNIDSAVNVLDMISVSQHWGETGNATWIRQDVNGDGVVNVLDLILIGQHLTG